MAELHHDASARSDEGMAIRAALAENMRRIRLARGLSLRELSAKTGLSKALLSQIEREVANPTVSTLTRVAAGLDISFTEMTKPSQLEPVVIRAADPSSRATGTRMIFSMMERHRFDISEGFLQPGDHGIMTDHGSGSIEYGYVVQGDVELTIADEVFPLGAGDAVQFSAAQPHVYRSLDRSSTLITVVAYADD